MRRSARRPKLVRSITSNPVWRFLRRLFSGVVLIYVFTCWIAGERPSARTICYSLTGLWVVLQLGWIWMERRSAPRSMSAARMNANSCRSGGIVKRTGYFLELIAFNLALTLFLTEYGLRLYGAWSGRSLLVGDTIDAYKLVPGHDYGGGLRGNNFGYPGPDFQQDKRPEIRRLAVLGDSFAVGPAVPFADNFLTLLEDRLQDMEIYNFGVSSTGPREYREVLHEDVWQLHPAIVVVCDFGGNDITAILPTPRCITIDKNTSHQFLSPPQS